LHHDPKRGSGTSTANRAELRTVLDFLRKGDVLMVTCIDRLARSIGDLQDIVRTNRAGQGRFAEPPAANDPVARMQSHRRQGAEA
jgi:hypothetical protein